MNHVVKLNILIYICLSIFPLVFLISSNDFVFFHLLTQWFMLCLIRCVQKGKHSPGNQTKFFFDWKVFSVDRKVFPLTGKCFPLTNFSNGKQTQESLESGFPESEFRETNMVLGFF